MTSSSSTIIDMSITQEKDVEPKPVWLLDSIKPVTEGLLGFFHLALFKGNKVVLHTRLTGVNLLKKKEKAKPVSKS